MQRDYLDRIDVDGSNTRQNGSLGFRWRLTCGRFGGNQNLPALVCWSVPALKKLEASDFFIEHRGSLNGYIA